MASLYCDAGLCKLCPVPKNILLSVTSIPGAFQTADPDGANFLTLVINPFPMLFGSSSILCVQSIFPESTPTAAIPPLVLQHSCLGSIARTVS